MRNSPNRSPNRRSQRNQRSRSRRNQRSQNRRRNRRSRRNQNNNNNYTRYSIVIPNPERVRSELHIRIPSPERCMSPYVRSTNYCGNKPTLPPGYTRRGTTYECLRKGFGAGACSIYR